MSIVRGVVVCPRYEMQGKNVSLNSLVLPQDMRRYLLYWDRIAYAYPNGFGKPNLDASPDLQFLEREGLLTLCDTKVTTADLGRPETPTPSHASETIDGSVITFGAPTPENQSGLDILGHPLALWLELNYMAPIRAAESLQAAGDSIWSTAYTGTLPQMSSDIGASVLIAEAAIVGALPVPSEEVSIQEILEFKAKRQSELVRLRIALDKLRDSALNSVDLPRGLAHARDELSSALADLDSALAAGGLNTFFSTLKLYLDVSENKFLASAAGGSAAAYGLEFPIELGALVGMGINSALTFAARLQSPPPLLPPSMHAFTYLYELKRHWKTQA
jgi:hypothetical protein